MLKEYFTKLLPTDGKIKDGELYLQYLEGVGFPNEIRRYNGGALDCRDKPIRLFLCSKKIQVGDKIKFQLVPNKSPWKDGEVLWVEADMTEIRLDSETTVVTTADHFCFKIIGEISPSAISFVKGSQKFYDSEINIYLMDKKVPMEARGPFTIDEIDIFKEQVESRPDRFYFLVEIKGPCGHFH